MVAKIINGNDVSKIVYSEVKTGVIDYVNKYNNPPGLAVVLIGNDPASISYVSKKETACKEVGIYTKTFNLSEKVSQSEVLKLIGKLNFDNTFNKICATLTGGEYCHSDFIFKWNKDDVNEILERVKGLSDIRERHDEYMKDGYLYVCFHVYWGDSVGYRVLIPDHINKYWSVPDTDMKQIECNKEDEHKLLHWCMKQLGKKYDYFGALTYFLRSFNSLPQEYNKFYCSMFMVNGLQQIDMFNNINPRAIIPNKLYKMLK